MGDDSCHHSGEFRPSKYMPFPSSISPTPLHTKIGAYFEDLLRDGDKTKPFNGIARLEDGNSVALDVDEVERMVEKVVEADVRDEVLVVMAHDDSMLPVMDIFPKYANDFMKNSWVDEGGGIS